MPRDDDAVVSQSGAGKRGTWGSCLEEDSSASFVQLFSVCNGIQFHSFMRLIEFAAPPPPLERSPGSGSGFVFSLAKGCRLPEWVVCLAASLSVCLSVSLAYGISNFKAFSPTTCRCLLSWQRLHSASALFKLQNVSWPGKPVCSFHWLMKSNWVAARASDLLG